jgi:hypothetical protein
MRPGNPKEYLQILRRSISIPYIAGMFLRGCGVDITQRPISWDTVSKLCTFFKKIEELNLPSFARITRSWDCTPQWNLLKL